MRQIRPLLGVIFSFLLFNQTAVSAETNIVEHSIKSGVFNEEFTYFVKLPATHKTDSNHAYPTIYLLDEDAYVQLFFNVSDILSQGGLTPEFIIVGVSHNQRLRDYTPTSLAGRSDTGGADKFLQYIEAELIPLIEKQYPTNGYRVLAGHSMGGLFTLHAIQAKPDLFNAHFAFSPSLFWDNKTTVNSVKRFLKSRASHHNFLYMNMANEGLDDPYDNSIAMREGYIELVDYIERHSPEKFRFASEHLEQEYHMSTIVDGPFHALRTLYRKYPLPTADIKQGLGSILRHYQVLSEEVGTQILPTQGRMFNAGMYHLWAQQDLDKGIEILEYSAQAHPTSHSTVDGLAQLYRAHGNLNKALQYSNRSLQLGDPESAYYQHYKRLNNEIKQQMEIN